MKVHALDPGPTRSGFAVVDVETLAVDGHGVEDNRLLMDAVRSIPEGDVLAIEMPAPRGQPMALDEMETIYVVGRFAERFGCDDRLSRITRHEVKMTICGRANVKDANVRQAVIDRYGGDRQAKGGIKCPICKGKGWVGRGRPPCEFCQATGWDVAPGPLYGVATHAWQALALALTWIERSRA